jgi:FtsH-binding integral membrane protein
VKNSMPASAAPALADRANAVQDKFAKIMACALIVMMAFCALNPDQPTINKALIALAILAVLGLAGAFVIEARDVK